MSINNKKLSINSLSDELLIEKFIHTNENIYLMVLHRRYLTWSKGIGKKYLNDKNFYSEVIADVFLKFLEKVNHEKLKPTSVKNYLYNCLKNECIRKNQKEVKKRKLLQLYDQSNQCNIAAEMESVYRELFTPELVDTAFLVIQKMKPLQRRSIELFYFENKGYEDITKILELSHNQVKSHIQNGRRKLKKGLKDKRHQSNDLLLVPSLYHYKTFSKST
ncbi:MAG: sigma-70 family RNA polymerase sigma factor [Bacteroidota bacterium]